MDSTLCKHCEETRLWLAHTTAPQVYPIDRCPLDLVIYGATPLGGTRCCDATIVSPLTRTGQPQPCAAAAATDGAALRVAERRKLAYPELSAGGLQQLVVLGAEVGGCWNAGALRLFGKAVVVTSGCGCATRGRQHGAGQRLARAHMREPAAGPRARPDPAQCRAGEAVTPDAALAASSGMGRR